MGILPGHWYYNTESGELTHGNNLSNLGNNLVGGAGWHELNISGNATEVQAAAAAKKEFPSGTTPTTSLATGESNALQQETGTTGLTQAVEDIGSFFHELSEGALWERVGEVLVGVLLIYIGVKALAAPAGTPVARQTAKSTASRIKKLATTAVVA